MTYDEHAARAKLDALLELPEKLAGASAAALDTALAELERFTPAESEFGPLLAHAETVLATVCSALQAMRDKAQEREP
jgi:hypothetical protein